MKPNIVLIMSDDQGHWAMNCAGNNEIISPNLNRLYKSGTMFESFFCVSPVCSPARLSIFTGKIPSAHGVHDWLHKGHMDYENLSDELKEKYKQEDLPWQYSWGKNQLTGDIGVQYLKEHTTFTQILNDNGYNCGISGKWHMGDSFNPSCGFDYWKTIALGGDNYYYPIVLQNEKMEMLDNVYITDYITDNAIEFLNQNENNNFEDKPFYLSVHYTAPHSPWDENHHPAEILELYNDCDFESTPYELPHKWSNMQYENDEDYKKDRKKWLKGYFTAITAMDKGIGKIIDKIEKMGIRDNTIIIFTSDNGMSMGHHGIFGKGNGTYPMNMYDSAVKVPMIISAPGYIKQNIKNDELLSHYDIFPTIMDMLDLSDSLPQNLPGKSFLNIIKEHDIDTQKTVSESFDKAIVVMDEYGPVRMIRTKEYKYIHRYIGNQHEFFDLINDPDEKVNLYDDKKYSQIINELKGKLEEWFSKYSDEKYDGKDLPVCGIGQLTPVYPKDEDTKSMFMQFN